MDEAEKIYQRLIAPIEDRMIRTIARMVRDPDDAADAFQNALASIWKNLKKIDQHPNPHGYILRICANAAYDSLRKLIRRCQRDVPLESVAPIATPGGQDAELEAESRRQALFGSVARLPRKQAQAVLLRVRDEQSFAAMAQVMGCTEATARSNFSKGIARLRTLCKHLNLEN